MSQKKVLEQKNFPLNLQEGLDRMQKAMSGDVVMAVSPATVNQAATATSVAPADRTATVTLKTAAGELHDWYDAAHTAKLAISDNNSASTATATIPSTTLTFVRGQAVVVISCTASTWASGKTNTLQVKNISVLGKNCATVTSVCTFQTNP